MSEIRSPVSVDAEASDAEVVAVREVFARHGFAVDVTAEIERRGAFVAPWIVQAALLLSFQGFFKGFGEAAGKDAYEAVKTWIRDIIEARQTADHRPGSVQLDDPEGTHLEFPTGISDRAFEALRDIDWAEWTGAWMVWDEDRGVWYDPTRR